MIKGEHNQEKDMFAVKSCHHPALVTVRSFILNPGMLVHGLV